MLKQNIMGCFFLVSLLASSATAAPLTFVLGWTQEKTSFDVTTYELPITEAARVGETGPLLPSTQLPMDRRELKKGELKGFPGETKYVLLVIKNREKAKVSFAVAPHQTQPAHATLGFKFRCLCNGHVYHVGPKEEWYRIMALKIEKTASEGAKVDLQHVIFRTDH